MVTNIVGTQTIRGWTVMSLDIDHDWWRSFHPPCSTEDDAIQWAITGILQHGQSGFQVQRHWTDDLVESTVVFPAGIGGIVISPWGAHPTARGPHAHLS